LFLICARVVIKGLKIMDFEMRDKRGWNIKKIYNCKIILRQTPYATTRIHSSTELNPARTF
jgi:hypothetical protein